MSDQSPTDLPLERDEYCCRPMRLKDGRVRWRVWAPFARGMELVLLDGQKRRTVAMEREREQYFVYAEEGVAEGQRYFYRIDGGGDRPDPCSVWQPDGVHRASAVAFPETFQWSDAEWKGIKREDLVFYELHVGTFTPEGTFEAIIPRLASLKELGVNALEIMPVAQFPGTRNWGYDGVQLYAPQHNYGGPHGLCKLVDAAHAAGIAVYLDVVYNHLGPEGSYVGEFGPYLSERYRTAWGSAFNYDGPNSDAVRMFVLDNVWYWITNYHLDGLRLDAVHSMFDNSPWHILAEVKETADAAAKTQGRTASVVVESLLNDIRMILPPERGGYGLDAEWNEDFHHALIAYLTGEANGKYVDFGPVQHLPKVINQTYLLSGIYSRFRRKRWGRPVGDLSGDRFIIGIQNHDHVGNRAVGDRLSRLIGRPAYRMAASLMLLSPHLPFLFMGEEYGEDNPFLFFTEFSDPQIIENVRVGRRRDYSLEGEVPDPQAESSFTASKLDWRWPAGSDEAGIRRLYQDLLAVRTQWPALGNYEQRFARLWPDDTRGSVLEMIRGGLKPDPENTVTCYFNLTETAQDLPASIPDGQVRLFSSEEQPYLPAGQAPARGKGQLLPFECQVYGPPSYRRLNV